MEYLSWNKIGIVDLTEGAVYEEELDNELCRTRIGGAGITSKLYERFEEEDPIVLGTGLLTGTLVPGASLGVMTARSPLTGAMAHAPFCLFAGAEMKYSGFDYLVVKGVAEKPVYLWIRDGLIDIADASEYWGWSPWQIVDNRSGLRDVLGDELIQFLSIGKAGEELLDIAQVMVNCWGSGDRWGFGKLFGKKRLKSMAMRGMGLLEIADPEKFVIRCAELMAETKRGPALRKKGSIELSAAFGDEDISGWAAPLLHRHIADCGCPYPMNSFLKYNEDPRLLQETEIEEPGFLVTDVYGLLGFKKMGLSAEDSCRMLEACSRLGVEPVSASNALQGSAQMGFTELEKKLLGLAGPFQSSAKAVFSPFSPRRPMFADFGLPADGDKVAEWWKRRQAVAYVFGIHPTFALMAPELSEERLIDLANTGAELELDSDTLEKLIEDICR